MAKIRIRKGIDVPIEGAPQGNPQDISNPKTVALDLSDFSYLRLHPLKKIGDGVLIGEPIVEDKKNPEKVFLSPGSGKIQHIERGEKRALTGVIIENLGKEQWKRQPISIEQSASDLVHQLEKSGCFSHIQLRPFCVLPEAKWMPKRIFVKALESAPFVPPSEFQIEGNEEEFQFGLSLLSKISKELHLVCKKDTQCKAILHAKDVNLHFANGPHPIANPSVHIHKIAPIQSKTDFVWSLDVLDVITIGKLFLKGEYHIDRIVSIAGPCIKEEKRGYFKTRMGASFQDLLSDKILGENIRVISGDPLSGKEIGIKHLGFRHTSLSAFSNETSREMLHFFRWGRKKYSATKTYFSGFFPKKTYAFTTNQHGENRAFIDGTIYEKMMPLRVPTMHLVKAILAEDFALAEELGLLEIAPEDFALPTFICPSKIEMVEIVRKGLKRFAEESLPSL